MYLLEYPEERPEDKPLPSFEFTHRDGNILCDIHNFEGMLSQGQIQALYFTSAYQTRIRMNKLWHHDFVKKANRKWRMSLPDQIFWLSPKGAEFVASTQGLDLSEFHWRRKPRAKMVHHELAVNDFRINVLKACEREEEVALEQWVTSREFWAYPDTIEVRGEDGKITKRQVKPDGFFALRAAKRRFRFLLEIDLESMSNPRFQRQHVRNSLAYLKSQAYEARFGDRSGHVLVVTTSMGRMMNMKSQTEATVGDDAHWFLFTTFEAVKPETVLAKPIWYQGRSQKPITLLTVT